MTNRTVAAAMTAFAAGAVMIMASPAHAADVSNATIDGEFDVTSTVTFVDDSSRRGTTVGERKRGTMTVSCTAGSCDLRSDVIPGGTAAYESGRGRYRAVRTWADVQEQTGDESLACVADLEWRVTTLRVTTTEEIDGRLQATQLRGVASGYHVTVDREACAAIAHFVDEKSSFVATLRRPADQTQDTTGASSPDAPAAAGPPSHDALPAPPGSAAPTGTAPSAPSVPPVAFAQGRPNVVAALPSVSEVPWRFVDILVAGLLAIALVLLIVFPSQLFNSTFDEHYDAIMAGVRRRVTWLRRLIPARAVTAAPPRRRTWPGFVALTAVAALLYGLLDPAFGANEASVVLLLGFAAGIVIDTVVSASAGGWAARRFGRSDYYFRVLPATLLVAAVCVGVSRLVGFLPGYIYGLVGGLAFRQALEDDDEARKVLLSSGIVLVAAVAGWLAYGPVSARIDAGADGFEWLVLEAILAGTFIAGVEGLLFGLIPLKYMSGEKLLAWSKRAWAAIYVVVAFAFIHLIARPAAAADAAQVSWAKTLTLFAAFGVASIAFWSYWRRRDRREGSAVAATASIELTPPTPQHP